MTLSQSTASPLHYQTLTFILLRYFVYYLSPGWERLLRNWSSPVRLGSAPVTFFELASGLRCWLRPFHTPQFPILRHFRKTLTGNPHAPFWPSLDCCTSFFTPPRTGVCATPTTQQPIWLSSSPSTRPSISVDAFHRRRTNESHHIHTPTVACSGGKEIDD